MKANRREMLTGLSAAAIRSLEQESQLYGMGQLSGRCYLVNEVTGDTVRSTFEDNQSRMRNLCLQVLSQGCWSDWIRITPD